MELTLRAIHIKCLDIEGFKARLDTIKHMGGGTGTRVPLVDSRICDEIRKRLERKILGCLVDLRVDL